MRKKRGCAVAELLCRGGIRRRQAQAAFTLIELLVVIAIIAVLASILVPALRNAMEQAYSAHCINNLHQLSLVYLMYVTDHDGKVPVTAGTNRYYDRWPGHLEPYGGWNESAHDRPGEGPIPLTICPSARKYWDFSTLAWWNPSFMLNNFAAYNTTAAVWDGGNFRGPRTVDEQIYPTKTWLFFDGDVGATAWTPGRWRAFTEASSGGGQFAYKRVSWYRHQDRMNVSCMDGHTEPFPWPGKTFPYPGSDSLPFRKTR